MSLGKIDINLSLILFNMYFHKSGNEGRKRSTRLSRLQERMGRERETFPSVTDTQRWWRDIGNQCERTSDRSRNQKVYSGHRFFFFLKNIKRKRSMCTCARFACWRDVRIRGVIRSRSTSCRGYPTYRFYDFAASNLHDSRRVIDREGKKKVTINFHILLPADS